MTSGPIVRQLILFSIPLLIGNLFQQLYNTVDSIIVGNFVGSEALTAVGASTPLINLLIGFFMGITTAPMVILVLNMCVLRQVYLMLSMNSAHSISMVYLCYPLTWFPPEFCMLLYYRRRCWIRHNFKEAGQPHSSQTGISENIRQTEQNISESGKEYEETF